MSGKKRTHLLEAFFIAIVGLILIELSGPQFIAAFHALSGDVVLNKIKLGDPVSENDIDILISSRKDSLSWVDSGAYTQELGLALMQKAYFKWAQSSEGQAYLAESIKATTAGLALSPANSFSWMRLAQSTALSELGVGDKERIASFLKMSIIVGPYEKNLVVQRLGMILAMKEADVELIDKGTLEKQIRFAAVAKPVEFGGMAKNYREKDIETIRSVLKYDEAILRRFNYFYKVAKKI